MTPFSSGQRLLIALLLAIQLATLAGCQGGLRMPGSNSVIPGQWEPEVEEDDVDSRDDP